MEPLKEPINFFLKHISNISSYARNMQLDDIKNGSIKDYINILMEEEPISSPFTDGISITFPKTFLYLLYSVCYYCFINTEKIMELELSNAFDGNIIPDEFTEKAGLIINYSLNLRNRFIPWPSELLNPNSEDVLIKDTNVIFAYSLTYIYFHEYAHIKLGHCCCADKNTILQQEIEADNFSLGIILDPDDNDITKRDYGIGIACAGIAMLFAINEPQLLSQKTHPDIDIRLGNSMAYLNIIGKKENYYLYKLLTVGLVSFCDIHKIQISQEIYDTVEDHYCELLRIVQEFKDNLREI